MQTLIKPRIKGKFLFCDNKTIKPIRLPEGVLGSLSNIQQYTWEINENKKPIELVATERTEIEERRIKVLPVYSKKTSHQIGDAKIPLRVRIADTLLDYKIANSIIESEHYLKPPRKGLVVLIEFINEGDKTKIGNSNCDLDFVEKAIYDSSNIIGCAVIDTLYYANPVGRKEIAEKWKHQKLLKLSSVHLWKDLRVETMEELRIAWISRVAIHKCYQKTGMGTLLVRELPTIVSKCRLPFANYLEVFTTHQSEIARDMLSGNKESFFVKAGYNLYGKLLGASLIHNFGKEEIETHRKLYFYRKVKK